MARISELNAVIPDGNSEIAVVYQGVSKKSKLSDLGNAINNSELQRITNIAGTIQGWRLLGSDVTYRLEIAKGAIDLSYQDGGATGILIGGASNEYASAFGRNTLSSGIASSAFGYGQNSVVLASGDASFACGIDTTASGNASFACGFKTIAQGSNSFSAGSSTNAQGNNSSAFGDNTTSGGLNSVAFGLNTVSSGDASFACGNNSSSIGTSAFSSGEGTIAQNVGQSALGTYNEGTSSYTILEIGVGTNTNRRNAFEVFTNGRIRATQLDMTLVNHPRSLITKEYMEEYSGELQRITETNSGWRMRRVDNANYGDIGQDAIDMCISRHASTTIGATGTNSFSIGYETTASGLYSTSTGCYTVASGAYSTSEGFSTTASGKYSHAEGKDVSASAYASHAEGHYTTASGIDSHAEGNNTVSSGASSHAEGEGTIAQNQSSHAEGKYNIGTSLDTIHETGIGLSSVARKNAFEIYTDGRLRAPEALSNSMVTDLKSLITTEFIKDNVFINSQPLDYIATASQSLFTVADSSNVKQVFINGILLHPSKYTIGLGNISIDADIYEGDWIRFEITKIDIQLI